MWARLVVAPWWVRWLVSASVFAVLLVAIFAWVISGFVSTGWPWALVSVVVFSLIVTALTTLAQRPISDSYAPAIAGLNLSQRKQVVRALRRGEVPVDPQVLAAAIRVGTLSLAYHRRVPDRQRKLAWCVPALWVVAGILQFVGGSVGGGLTWTGLAVLIAARLAWASYRVRRLPERLQLLRAAADSSPQALSTLAQAHDSVAAPPGLKFRLASVAMVLIAVVAAIVVVYQRARPTPDCRTADTVVGFIHDHPILLNPQLITEGGPGVDEYQAWSDQLVAYSRQVSAPDLAPHLHRIAAFSRDAVRLVTEVRGDPSINQSPDETRVRQLVYGGIIDQILEEDKALIPPCHPRR